MMKVLIPGAVAWAIINAVMLWCCCAINRKNSATAPCIADTREPDENGKIANGCECQNTER